MMMPEIGDCDVRSESGKEQANPATVLVQMSREIAFDILASQAVEALDLRTIQIGGHDVGQTKTRQYGSAAKAEEEDTGCRGDFL